jgi:hypothetical protein
MLLTLQSFSIPVKLDTKDIIAFIWSIELGRIEIVLRTGKRIPIDHELWELEAKYQEGLDKGKKD